MPVRLGRERPAWSSIAYGGLTPGASAAEQRWKVAPTVNDADDVDATDIAIIAGRNGPVHDEVRRLDQLT